MALEKSIPFKLICILAIAISVLVPAAKSQVCSIEGIDLGVCVNRRNSSISINGKCCRELNKAVRAGYNCLCVLIASSLPVISTPITLPLSNCFISVPSLTFCKVIAPIPITFPPNIVNQPSQPSLPHNDLPVSVSPPQEIPFILNSTRQNSSITVATQPPSSENPDTISSPSQESQVSSNSSSSTVAETPPPPNGIATPEQTLSEQEIDTSNGENKTMILLYQNLSMLLALLVCVIY